jgi:xylan 1,4-beta-xylosidase
VPPDLGPYEGNPANPILTHRSTADPVQNTGHADLVQLPSGEWAAVYLGVRPRGFAPQFHVNGRETFLAAIRWEDDRPVFDEGHYQVPPADTTFIDDFGGGALRPQWISRAGDPLAFAALGVGGLTLRSPDQERGEREFLAVRARDDQWAAEAVIRAGWAASAPPRAARRSHGSRTGRSATTTRYRARRPRTASNRPGRS